MFSRNRHAIFRGLFVAAVLTFYSNTSPALAEASRKKDYGPGDYVEKISSSGKIRQYRLHIPSTLSPGIPAPLVINFHGFNSSALQQEQLSKMCLKADEAAFIAVHPEGLGDPQKWYIGPRPEGDMDIKFIRDLIQHLEMTLSIDPKRIYVTGISNGAQMANRLGCELSLIIAAIGPVSGGYSPFERCHPVQPMPVVAFHGTEDKLLPYEGRGQIMLPIREWAADWAARNRCDQMPTVTFQHGEVTGETWGNCEEGAEVTLYTIYGKGHSWPGSDMPPKITTKDIDATDVIWEFFENHPKP